MSRLFVSKEPVAVYERDDLEPYHADQNVVFIKPKMSHGDRAVYQDALLYVPLGSQSEYHVAQAEVMLLKINVVRWDGPDFRDPFGRPLPCTPEQIELNDPTEPFWQKVLGEINARNRPRQAETADDPNGAHQASPTSTAATLPGSPESALAPEATTTSP